ncbi:MAG: hypothetical protein WCO93_04000 [bacterium]
MRLNPYNSFRIGGQAQGILLLLILVAGLLCFAQYGISWDEQTQRNSGIVFFNHIQETFNLHPVTIPAGVPNLEDYRDREFGASFETFLFGLERLLGFNDYKQVFLFRHLVNFLFFWLGVMVFGTAVKSFFRRPILPIAGCLILFLHPRIFADSFYNSKDIILMVFFIFSFRAFLVFNESWKIRHGAWFALLSALAFNIRPAGILIPMLAALVMLPAAIRQIRNHMEKHRLIALIFYILFFILFVWLTNPYLWDNPFAKSYQVITKFLKYDVSHTAGNLLFMGKYMPTNSLPWYYLPAWIGVTTPVVYLLLILPGVIVMVRRVVAKVETGRDLPGKRILFYTAGWLFLPLLTAIIFHSTLYDGWRHFYFIWPAMVLAGLYGFDAMLDLYFLRFRETVKKSIKLFTIAALVLSWVATSLFIYRCHPHQYSYFNILAPDPARNFELDYWGLSYRDGLNDLVKRNPSGNISVRVLNLPGYLNAFLLEPGDRDRFWYHHSLQEDYSSRIDSYFPFRSGPHILEQGKEVKYYISNFRDTSSPDELEKYRKGLSPYTGQVFSCMVDNLEILGVYQLQP